MGVLISRDDDSSLYRDTYEESQRIIRISDEVRMSMEKVKPVEEVATNEGAQESESQKISSSKVAKSLRLKTAEFLERLVVEGYISDIESKNSLTAKGISAGGEYKFSKRFGSYYLWPSDFNF